MFTTYKYMMPDSDDENRFRLVNVKADAVVERGVAINDSDIESCLHVRYELTDTEKHTKVINIECSSDGIHWSSFEPDYEDFKQNVSYRIKQMLANEETGCHIPFRWIEGFQIICCVRECMGYARTMFNMGIGLIEREGWKTKVWDIFDDLDDSFWNSDRVRIGCTITNNETEARLMINYCNEISTRWRAESRAGYYNHLLDALSNLLCDTLEDLPLKFFMFARCVPDSVMKKVDRELAVYGASVIRKNHAFYISRSRLLQEGEKQEVKKRCSCIVTTFQSQNPRLYLLEFEHKVCGGCAVVGCYREQETAASVMKYLTEEFPESAHVEYRISRVCSSAISKRLLRRLDYTDVSVLQRLECRPSLLL